MTTATPVASVAFSRKPPLVKTDVRAVRCVACPQCGAPKQARCHSGTICRQRRAELFHVMSGLPYCEREEETLP